MNMIAWLFGTPLGRNAMDISEPYQVRNEKFEVSRISFNDDDIIVCNKCNNTHFFKIKEFDFNIVAKHPHISETSFGLINKYSDKITNKINNLKENETLDVIGFIKQLEFDDQNLQKRCEYI
jgi:hypothetical protein